MDYTSYFTWLGICSILSLFRPGFGILCYQCGTDQEPDMEDQCGTKGSFRPGEHSLVDCSRDEANSPGAMCLKYTQLSPRAFIWDRRWKSVIRRCAQVSSHGQLQGCDWGYDSRGTYWEQCYCTTDACNSGWRNKLFIFPAMLPPMIISFFLSVL